MILHEKTAVIVGPTAVGKTAISIRTADILGAEIISGDSMQVYRGMDIGTAKIREEEMVAPSGVKITHHLIDIIDPDKTFSAADFQKMTRKIISKLNSQGKLPMIVGGTGLYINAVLDPYNFEDMAADESYRQKKREEVSQYGYEHLHSQLQRVDPVSASRIHPNDTRRIIRALEVYHQTGKTLTKIQEEGLKDRRPGYQAVLVGLVTDREMIYRRINERVDIMIKSGLIEEVESLLKKGYHSRLNSMQGLGYRQIAAYLQGILNKEEAIELIKRDTRHFAKRQLTWFRRDKRIQWFDINNYQNKDCCAEEIASYIGRSLGVTVEYNINQNMEGN